FAGPPRLVGDATQHDARIANAAIAHIEPRGDRYEREGVARPVTHLEIVRMVCEARWWQVDRDDQLVGRQVGVTLRRRLGKTIELADGDAPLSVAPTHIHH